MATQLSIPVLAQTYEATTQPDSMAAASEALDGLCGLPGFCPLTLQLLVEPEVNDSAKFAAALYVKNFIVRYWHTMKKDPKFIISDADKTSVRQIITKAICEGVPKYQLSLSIAYARICSWDFPTCWDGDLQTVIAYTQSSNIGQVHGGLRCFYEITLKYNTKDADECQDFYAVILQVFPTLLTKLQEYLNLATDESFRNADCILKIFLKTIEYTLPLCLVDSPTFQNWIETFFQIINMPVPEKYQTTEEEDRSNIVWKCKRHTAHILHIFLNRYGTPNMCGKEYKPFASVFIVNYGPHITELCLNQFLASATTYTPNRMIHRLVDVLNAAIYHSKTYCFIRDRFHDLLQLMLKTLSHSDLDEAQWQENPFEYIFNKFDPMKDFKSETTACTQFLIAVAKKRSKTLEVTLNFCYDILQKGGANPQDPAIARQRDGALAIIGSLAFLIHSKKQYKGVLEPMLKQYIFPDFNSTFGFLRARACFTVNAFASQRFQDSTLITACTEAVVGRMGDPELPVRVVAAKSLENLIQYIEAQQVIKPMLTQIMEELIKLMNDTANNELTDIVQSLLTIYGVELSSYIVSLTQVLSHTCVNMLNYDEEAADASSKAVTAYGLIQTITTIVMIFRENRELMPAIESAFAPILRAVFEHRILDFLEDILSLMADTTELTQQINPDWWVLFPVMYDFFDQEASDYFDEFVGIFISFVSFDTEKFLSNPDYVKALYDMCKRTIENEDTGEFAEREACRLIEVILLHCVGRIDEMVPMFIHLLMKRYSLPFNIEKTKIHVMETVVECVYYNPIIALQTLESLQENSALTIAFFNGWFDAMPSLTRVHDIRVQVSALCRLLKVHPDHLPVAVQQGIPQITAALILNLHNYPDAVKAKHLKEEDEAAMRQANAAIPFSQEDSDEEVCEDDEDVDDAEGDEYLRYLASLAANEYEEDEIEDILGEDTRIDESTVADHSPMDNVNPFLCFADAFENEMQGGRPKASFDHLLQQLPETHQPYLPAILEQAALAKNSRQNEQDNGQGYQFRA